MFEQGGASAWDADFAVDQALSRVPRHAVHSELLDLLSPHSEPETHCYAVVVGASGTGKSTAVRKAVRAVGSGSVKGAVYFLAPTGITSFSSALMRALDCHEPFSLLSLRYLLSKESSLPQPVATWRMLAPKLQAAAALFQARHGRPAVLVLDAMDLVAEEAPPFLTELQAFAKECADRGTLRLVLVCSDGHALPLLQGNSALSRALPPLEIGDIGDAEAVAYLVALGVGVERAEALVREVAGGRFPLLQTCAISAKSVQAIVQQLHGKTAATLRKAGVSPTCPLFAQLLAHKVIPEAAALKLLGSHVTATLLGLGILAAHPDGTLTFHSRHVESFVAGEVAESARR